ncbi:hypothetical protein N7493_002787 [Penicillium malachiteum]|uniref:Aminoglycoside phosphotransferase domain-containing protein n=1 Tax=Penicillium malachiteum TaxID=1324776 RepID=A0AAD6HT26_9EURO|nr:hypothetical protein N7493_002787 [Penicillium malachiteum]
MDYDDMAWEISDRIADTWVKHLFDPDTFMAIGHFLLKHHDAHDAFKFKVLQAGAFNTALHMEFLQSRSAIIRFPLPGATMFPEEKLQNEVATIRFIGDQSPIPVPMVLHWAGKKESPLELAPFLMMEYIDHHSNMINVLKTPGRPLDERVSLNPDISKTGLETLYRGMANVIFSMSKLSKPKIGSLYQIDDFTWEVARRPLSLSMNELRNDAIDSADDCRRKFVARFLLRKLVRDETLKAQWIHPESDHGPFPIWCDDFRPGNVLVDADLNITGVFDWEFTYTAPIEFTYAPPLWLILEKPEYWRAGYDDWAAEYQKKLEIFLRATIDCEEEAIRKGRLAPENHRLSSAMRRSWESEDFWIMYAARDNFAFDFIFWTKIDVRFFGERSDNPHICDIWRERLDLLEPAEKDFIEKHADVKLREMEAGQILAWDPDENTLEYMKSMAKVEDRSMS